MASSDIGSGYRVASRDLEIRGAGQVLGKKQSGHITTIGFDLYMKMISHAMKKVKGQELLNDNAVSYTHLTLPTKRIV